MREKKLVKGKEFLYVPRISDINNFGKVYFLFKTEFCDKSKNQTSWNYPKIIVAKNYDDTLKYQTLEDFRNAQSSSLHDFNGNGNYVFLEDKNCLKKYSNYNLKKAYRFYDFCKKKEKLYINLLSFSNLFLNSQETFYFSDDFENYRKYMVLIPLRFYFKCSLLILKGILRYIICPIIFFIDILKSSLATYIDFKKTEADVRFYSEKSYEMKCAYLGIDATEFSKQKNENEEKLKNQKDGYINSNIASFTLLIAFIGILFSLNQILQEKSLARKNLEVYQNKIEMYEDKIQKLTIENIQLKINMQEQENINSLVKAIEENTKTIISVNNLNKQIIK